VRASLLILRKDLLVLRRSPLLLGVLIAYPLVIALLMPLVIVIVAPGFLGGATLVLAGVTVASFFTAVQTFVQQQHSDTLQQVYSWILGSLPSSDWTDVKTLLPYAVIATVGILMHRRLLDVLSVGDDEAASLGVNVGRVRLVVVVCATVGTAAAVAVSGLIGFVGIIVPHAIRLVVGPSYRLTPEAIRGAIAPVVLQAGNDLSKKLGYPV